MLELVPVIGWFVTVVDDCSVVVGHPFAEVAGVFIFFGDCIIPVEGVEIEVTNQDDWLIGKSNQSTIL